MTNKFVLPLTGYVSWCGLGYYRGVKSHKYSHNKYDSDKPYIYTRSVINGIFGIGAYANPFFFPILLYKELYRLEVNVRNLEDEKKGSMYNDLL